MKTVALLVSCAFACGATAQEAAKNEAPQPPRPPLNLRLDESTFAAPRVTFGTPPATQTKEEREKALPELGGKPNDAYSRPMSSGINSATPSGTIPSAM